MRPFADSPAPAEMARMLNCWHRPPLPPGLERSLRLWGNTSTTDLFRLIRESLSSVKGVHTGNRLASIVIDWLYLLIRLNVKRGRVFDLSEVLAQGKADCTGYAKLFTAMGRMCGLNVGVVDVVIDNSGRLVPHIASLVLLHGRRHRFVDLWYGSTSIWHQKVGLRVKRSGRWEIVDVDIKSVADQFEISYLPDSCVDGITSYIMGNRHLNRGEYQQAVYCYSRALELYPGNPRFYYNRAIAYENLGKDSEAEADYALALQDDTALTRVLAVEHEKVTSLIDLDEKGIEDTAQAIYLLRNGFTIGRRVPLKVIARRHGLSEQEAEDIFSSVERRLATG
jgi:tetratricopeptide (TPR) repeat protein